MSGLSSALLASGFRLGPSAAVSLRGSPGRGNSFGSPGFWRVRRTGRVSSASVYLTSLIGTRAVSSW